VEFNNRENIMELTPNEIASFITSAPLVVIKAYADACPACDTFAPIWENAKEAAPEIAFGEIKVSRTQANIFTETYMNQGEDGVTIGTPMTFVFKDGELAYRYYGTMTLAELGSFIATGKTIDPDAAVKAARIAELDALVGKSIRETNEQIQALQEAHQQTLRSCEAEIKRIKGAI
jgi:thioredoxin 1